MPKATPNRAVWLSISAYARQYGVHRNTVAKWLESDALITYRFGRVVRVRNVPPANPRHSRA